MWRTTCNTIVQADISINLNKVWNLRRKRYIQISFVSRNQSGGADIPPLVVSQICKSIGNPDMSTVLLIPILGWHIVLTAFASCHLCICITGPPHPMAATGWLRLKLRSVIFILFLPWRDFSDDGCSQINYMQWTEVEVSWLFWILPVLLCR